MAKTKDGRALTFEAAKERVARYGLHLTRVVNSRPMEYVVKVHGRPNDDPESYHTYSLWNAVLTSETMATRRERKEATLYRALVDIRDSTAYCAASKARATMALEEYNREKKE